MTKNDNYLDLLREEKPTPRQKAALDKAKNALKAAGFAYWAIIARDVVEDGDSRKIMSVASDLRMDVRFSACAARTIFSEVLPHLEAPKEQLAYLTKIIKATLAEVNPALAKEIEDRVNRKDQSAELEKMN
ncbi:hypothetical protein ACTUHY_00515 [Acidaminococcus sp. LBK-2]|uniref:hypothetical protein n=1 Tax=Acidaminococcus sp. LBK-2 TaxID=3456956 RepID=UPI003FA4CB9D